MFFWIIVSFAQPIFKIAKYTAIQKKTEYANAVLVETVVVVAPLRTHILVDLIFQSSYEMNFFEKLFFEQKKSFSKSSKNKLYGLPTKRQILVRKKSRAWRSCGKLSPPNQTNYLLNSRWMQLKNDTPPPPWLFRSLAQRHCPRNSPHQPFPFLSIVKTPRILLIHKNPTKPTKAASPSVPHIPPFTRRKR